MSSDDIAARYLERFPHSNDLPAPERLRLVAPNLFGDIAPRSRLQETLGRNVVVTVGPDVDPERLGPQQPHVLVERYIPQALLLPHCSAVVAHAGAGTTPGALARGVPLVLLPHGAEQFLNAAACARAGAGLVLDPRELTPAAVRDALERVLGEPSFAAAAQTLRREIAAMPTADEALAALPAAR